LGYNYQRKNDRSWQFRQDNSLKKDKSRFEYQRTQLVGAGAVYKMKNTLGADRWVLKTHLDRWFNIEYDTGKLAQDAKSYHGNNKGYEFKAKLQGEYSTASYSWYVVPLISYRAQYSGYWNDTDSGTEQEAQRGERLELGLYLSWLLPVDGFELSFGPLWQQELDTEKLRHASWLWSKEQRTYAHIMLEYEEPIPGFELELEIEHVISGDNINDTKFTFELSYEF